MSVARAPYVGSRRCGLRWLSGGTVGAVAAVATASALVLGAGSARAATFIPVQLTLTGAAYVGAPTGGSVIGVHPGDSVSLSAGAVSTAILPSSLSGLLNGLLSGITGFQVTITSSAVPGLAVGTKLGGCGNLGDVGSVNTAALAAGQYDFSYSIQSLALLCLGVTDALTNSQLNELKGAGAALGADNTYLGHIVVATNPPSGGLGVQLPGVSAQPSLPVVGTLPKVTVPGVTVNVPVTIPGLGTPTGPATAGGTTAPGGGSTGASGPTGVTYSGGATIPDLVMPSGGSGLFGAGSYLGALGSLFGTVTTARPNSTGSPLTSSAGMSSASASTSPGTTKAGSGEQLNLADNKAPAPARPPVLLAVLAILALSLVTATYARLYLLRRAGPGTAT